MKDRNRVDYSKKFKNTEDTSFEEPSFGDGLENEIENRSDHVVGRVVLERSGDRLNIRSGAGLEFEPVKEIEHGKELRIIDYDGNEDCNDWYHVVTESGVEGYVAKAFVELV